MKLLPYGTLQGERVIWLTTAACKCVVVRTRALPFDPAGHSGRKPLGLVRHFPSWFGKAALSESSCVR